MGFRFQKRIRLFKGLTLNLSKSGTSWSVGRRGASVNLKDGKVTGNVGIPGTGMSYRERLDNGPSETTASKSGNSIGSVVLVLIVLAILGFILSR